MNERQIAYRQEYRHRLSNCYNGYIRIVIIYTIGLTALWIYAQHLDNVQGVDDGARVPGGL